MSDYNFHTLSPIEFEALSRDLLQKELGLTLESFTSGRDDGVDLRYSTAEGDDIIIQCKRHIASYSKLKSHLKGKELPKVQKLNPARYILTTSVGLTKKNKEEIKSQFSPFITSTSDIYGRDDLNNLLGKYEEIEKRHYKLWLSSIDVLETILHSDIINRTLFEREDIIESVTTYVENESYHAALEKFKNKNFVIIAGDAGIGKTTLARMLIYRMLGNKEYEQFVYVSRGVEEALSLYNPGKSQLFFFDDFLGRTAFDNGFARNEETDLVRFIDRITKSKNKGLLLATREYILRQAQTQYSELESPLLQKSKYTIDLAVFTRKIRADILYNHLFRTKLPNEYLITFLDKKIYKDIIGHSHYTPRLIATILQEEIWNDCTPDDFPSKFISYLNNPQKIWRDIYEKGLSPDGQLVMKILLTLKSPIELTKLHAAFDSCARQNNIRPDYNVFDNAIKELSDTFIKVSSSSYSLNTPTVDYKNPSILDFMIDYYKGSRSNDLAVVVDNAVYIDQIISRFCLPDKTYKNGLIEVTPELLLSIRGSILKGFDKLPVSTAKKWSMSTYSSVSRAVSTYSEILVELLFQFGFKDDEEVSFYLLKQFIKFNGDDVRLADYDSQRQLLDYFVTKLTKTQVKEAVNKLGSSITTMRDIDDFIYLSQMSEYETEVLEWLKNNSIYEETTEAIIADLEEVEPRDLHDYEDTLIELEKEYNFDFDAVYDRYQDLLREASTPPEDYGNFRNSRPSSSYITQSFTNDDKSIEEMFDSLKQI